MLQGAGAAGVRELALGYALILDGKNAQAIPVWQQIVAASEGTDFFVRAVLANLQHEPPKQPVLPNPQNYNEFLALAERT
jgi:hypothetical protein